MREISALLERIPAAWFEWMAAMSWQVALLVAVVLVLSLLARQASPRFRYLLWCLVFVKLCLPPSLAFVTGIGQWLPAKHSLRAEEGNATPALVAPSPAPAFEPPPVSEEPLEEVAAPARPAPAPPPAAPIETREARSFIELSWPKVLFALWIAGILAMAGMLCLQYGDLRKRLSSAKIVQDARILSLLEEARESVGLRSSIWLFEAPDLESPIVFGFLRPHMVLPSPAVRKLPREQLRAVLLHELTHVRRRDLMVSWFQVVLQALYWFHPLVWLASIGFRRERELIVDDEVITHLKGDREVYGYSLLSILRQATRKRNASPGYVGIIETKKSLTYRLRRIFDANRKLSIRLGWLSAVILIALGLVLIPQARSRASAATEEEMAEALPDGALMRIGTQRLRHESHVRTVAFSPDGKLLASADFDGDIRLWNPATGRLVRELAGRGQAVEAVSFSPDGKRLYSGGWGEANGFRVWDATTGEPIAEYRGEGHNTFSLALSPDGELVATGGSRGVVQLWDAHSGRRLQRFRWHNSSVKGLAFSPDGRFLASASREGARLWEVGSEKEALKLDTGKGECEAVRFSPDGKTLIAGGYYLIPTGERRVKTIGKLWFWDVDKANEVREVESKADAGEILDIVFSPDGKTMVTGCILQAIEFWDPATGKLVRTLQGRQGDMCSSVKLSFSPDGKTLAASGHGNTVVLWNIETGKRLHSEFAAHDERIQAVAYSTDGKTLASADAGGTICLWDSASGSLLRKIPSHEGSIVALAFSPDGAFLASGGWQETRVHDLKKGEGGFYLPAEGLATTSLAFSPDGATVAVAYRSQDDILPGQGTYVIRLFSLGNAKPIREFRGHADWISSVSFSADGKTLVSASRDRTVRLWGVNTGEEISRFEMIEAPISYSLPDGWGGVANNSLGSLALCPTGDVAAAACTVDRREGSVRIRDLATGRELRNLRLPGRARYMAFSSDGSLLAMACREGRPGIEPRVESIRVSDVAAGKQVAKFDLSAIGRPSFMAFSPDGKVLVSAMADTTIVFWDLEKARRSPPTELALAAKASEAGQLRIYPQLTGMGTAANRMFLDKEGFPTKAILYKPRDPEAEPPFTEQMLIPAEVVRFEYDRQLRKPVRTAEYTPEMELTRIRETSYDKEGKVKSIVYRDGKGRLQEESLGQGPPESISHRFYNVTGKKLIAVKYVLPDDMDLAYGWGPEHDGLQCGIAPDRESGKLEEIKIWVTVKNTSQKPKKLGRGLQYRILQMELRNADGNVVPQDAERIAERTEKLKFEPGADGYRLTIRPGLAQASSQGYALSDWYQDLQPGRYTLTIRRRAGGKDFSLLSNTVTILIQ